MRRSKEKLTQDLLENRRLYHEWRKKIGRRRKKKRHANAPNNEIDFERPNWHAIATSFGGRRFQVGLRGRRGCQYGRCINCMLFHGSTGKRGITPANIRTQFENALDARGLAVIGGANNAFQWTDAGKSDVQRVELTGSGSFLNDNEMPHEARMEIFRRVARTPFKKILVESRIEYIDIEQIEDLQGALRPDQSLTVAIGLESADDIIREMAIGKGFELVDFEDCVEELAETSADVLVYSLVKPAFISEAEALEDSVNTGRYLAGVVGMVRQRTGNKDFQLTMKLEPAFVQKDGFLHYLGDPEKHADAAAPVPLYETPWSFTVAEIVEQLIVGGFAERVNLQIGRSMDFPPPIDVTRNRDDDADLLVNDGRESSERIDAALQQYNADRDASGLLRSIRDTVDGYPNTVIAWQAKIGQCNVTG